MHRHPEPNRISSALHLGLAVWLVCAISLIPAARIQAVEVLSSSGTSKMVVVPMAEEEAPQSEEPASSKEDHAEQNGKPMDQPAYQAAEPKKTDSDQDNTWYLIGGGAAAAAALALALGGGGGGDGGGSDSGTTQAPTTTEATSTASTTTTAPTPTTVPLPDPTPTSPEPTTVEPVGPAIAGDGWAGYLDLVNGGRENVTAVVTQNGDRVTITTSSTQEYGKVFKGKIYSNGHMYLIDQTTGQDWTTHEGRAFSTQIDIYDWVNNFTALDRLFLKR